MTCNLKPIRNEVEHAAAMAEVARLWGAKSGTPDGDRLDALATLIDAFEAEHHGLDSHDPIKAVGPVGGAPPST